MPTYYLMREIRANPLFNLRSSLVQFGIDPDKPYDTVHTETMDVITQGEDDASSEEARVQET